MAVPPPDDQAITVRDLTRDVPTVPPSAPMSGVGGALDWQIDPFFEHGRTGLQTWGGYIFEEFLPELRGQRGMKTFREMADNCPISGAMLFAIEMLCRQVEWRVDANERATAKGQEYADLVSGMLFEDMSTSWSDVLSEVLTMLPYGFAPLEVVYKRRMGEQKDPDTPDSKFRDRLIGWRKWSIRAQETISDWDFDEHGGVRGLYQETLDAPRVYIPLEKTLLFRTSTRRGNPEGRSILRNAYVPYYYKRRIQEIEGIGIERDLAGLPVLTPPENVNIWDGSNPKMVNLLRQATLFVQSIRRDQREGVVKPNGWTFELMSTGSRRQFDTNAIVTRLEQRIAMSVLGDFVMVGHDAVGSKALATSKVHVFGLALTTILDAVCDVVNRFAMMRLGKLNGWKQDELPVLKHGNVEPTDLAELGAFITALSGAGMPLFPNPELERHLLGIAKLPVPPEGTPLPSEILQQQQDEDRLLQLESQMADEGTGQLQQESVEEDREMGREDRARGHEAQDEDREFTREDRALSQADRAEQQDAAREARGQGRVDQRIQRAGARLGQTAQALDIEAKRRALAGADPKGEPKGEPKDREIDRPESRPSKRTPRTTRRRQ